MPFIEFPDAQGYSRSINTDLIAHIKPCDLHCGEELVPGTHIKYTTGEDYYSQEPYTAVLRAVNRISEPPRYTVRSYTCEY